MTMGHAKPLIGKNFGNEKYIICDNGQCECCSEVKIVVLGHLGSIS